MAITLVWQSWQNSWQNSWKFIEVASSASINTWCILASLNSTFCKSRGTSQLLRAEFIASPAHPSACFSLLRCDTVHLYHALLCLSIPLQQICLLSRLTSLAGLNDYNFYLLVWAGDGAARAGVRLAPRTGESPRLLPCNPWGAGGQRRLLAQSARSEVLTLVKSLLGTLLSVRIRPHVTVANAFKSYWLSADD